LDLNTKVADKLLSFVSSTCSKLDTVRLENVADLGVLYISQIPTLKHVALGSSLEGGFEITDIAVSALSRLPDYP
jgi:hypothetical protein